MCELRAGLEGWEDPNKGVALSRLNLEDNAAPTPCTLASPHEGFARCAAQRGAGREVVGQLLASPAWGKVTTVGRRAVDVPAQYTGWEPSKLKQVLHCSSRLWGVVGSLRGMAGTTVALGLPSATHYTCNC